MPKPDLDNAYALKTVDDARRLYAGWAETYDRDFAERMDFVVPRRVAEAFRDAGGNGPVLDFGCGTGLVGKEFAALNLAPVDGADLSAEMLAVARRRGVYRNLIEGNVLDGLTVPDRHYSGVVSSGTFTHGHVGPEALDELLRIAVPDALFVLSINGEHYDSANFAAKFSDLGERVVSLQLQDIRFYGDAATGPHRNDTGYLAIFRSA
jgi:predicted TPR repeat methyltransferase